jgi:hypothetical protein
MKCPRGFEINDGWFRTRESDASARFILSFTEWVFSGKRFFSPRERHYFPLAERQPKVNRKRGPGDEDGTNHQNLRALSSSPPTQQGFQKRTASSTKPMRPILNDFTPITIQTCASPHVAPSGKHAVFTTWTRSFESEPILV